MSNTLPLSLIATLSSYEGKPVVATLHDGLEFIGDNSGTLRVTPKGVWVAGTGPLLEADLSVESYYHDAREGVVRVVYAEGYETTMRVTVAPMN